MTRPDPVQRAAPEATDAADARLSDQSRHYHDAFAASDFPAGSSHRRVLDLVGEDVRVLELGPATGYMTRALRARGCSVVGVELDPAAAEMAAEHAERMIVGDLDDMTLFDQLDDDLFDVVVAADVLEHLKQPTAVLERLRRNLKPDGRVVASLPNVTHVSVRIALRQGRFPYGPVGLLDHTHLRFFDREAVLRTFEDAGFAVGRLDRHRVPLEESSVPFDDDEVAREVIAECEHDDDAQTYQWIAVGHPFSSEVARDFGARIRELQERADRAQQLRYEINTLRHDNHVQAVEFNGLSERLVALARQEAELRALYTEAQAALLERDRKLERMADTPTVEDLRERLARSEEAAAYFRSESATVHAALHAIEASTSWRLVRLLRRLKRTVSR